MKALILTTLLTSSLALADISLGSASPAAPAPAETPAAEYIQSVNEVMSTLKELTGVLEGVTDQASADAAAPQVAVIAPRLIELQKKSESMPRPTPEVENQVRASINVQEVQQIVTSFLSSFIRIGMSNAYGSQALLNTLGPVMNCMPGTR